MKASIGRIVHFTFPHSDVQGFSSHAGQTQIVPAIIVCAFSDECVNLRVFPDSDGPSIVKTSVPLQNESSNPNDGFYWQWPSRD